MVIDEQLSFNHRRGAIVILAIFVFCRTQNCDTRVGFIDPDLFLDLLPSFGCGSTHKLIIAVMIITTATNIRRVKKRSKSTSLDNMVYTLGSVPNLGLTCQNFNWIEGSRILNDGCMIQRLFNLTKMSSRCIGCVRTK